MSEAARVHGFKLAVFLAWLVVIVASYVAFHFSGLPFRSIPHAVRDVLRQTGPYGPFLFLGVYAIQSVIPMPTVAIGVVAGTTYGAFAGSLLVIIGLNLAASISFWVARAFGRGIVEEREHGWVKKYDDLLAREGLLTVLVLRLLFFPFDLLSLLCGLSRMSYRQFAMGTFLGSLPGAITFVLLGGAFGQRRNATVAFIVMFLISLVLAFFIRRSAWVKRHLYVHEHAE